MNASRAFRMEQAHEAELCGYGGLNDDGSLDTTFATGTGANNGIMSINRLDNGKIIIGGNFTSYDGISRNHIAKLNEDGSLDTTFNPGVGANDGISKVSIQNDGKIIIVGFFTSYDGVTRNHIARLNADGSLDTTFDPGSGANHRVSSVAIQSDGKIIIGGFFTFYNGVARNYIARLNEDGSLDTSFDPGMGPENIFNSISLQSDGKIIIGGHFDSYDGIPCHAIARLNTDGSLDTTFSSGFGDAGHLWTTTVQDDGKILIGGAFNSYDDITRLRIARVNPDGSLDTTFDPGAGANDYVATISVQNDGKIIVGGLFTTFDGTAINRIARLNSIPTGIDDAGLDDGKIKIFPNPFSNTATIQTELELKNAALTLTNSAGQSVKQLTGINGKTISLNRDDLPRGLYFIRLIQDNNQVILTDKLVISD